MPDFQYTARDTAGKRVSGTLVAANEREVATQLGARSLFPVAVIPTPENRAAARALHGKRVSGQVMAGLYSQLAALLHSGVPLLRSLDVLRDQTSHRTLRAMLDDIRLHVQEGATLADAMNKHPRAFSEMARNMVRAGAEGGFLEDALQRVAQFTEQQEDLKSRTLGALAYPIVLASVGMAVVVGLMIFVVPNFALMFDRLRKIGELPWPTEVLLSTSAFLRGWGWLVAVLLVAIGVLLQARLQTSAGRHLADALKLKLPFVGVILQSLAVARFCRVLGTLLVNGVPILKALEISRDAAGNKVLSEAVEHASQNISAGQSLAGPLAASGHFPRTVVEMIAVAEESNSLDRVLVEIAEGLERRTFRRLDLAVRLVEPLLLLVLSSIVLLVVIALLLPVIKMSSTF